MPCIPLVLASSLAIAGCLGPTGAPPEGVRTADWSFGPLAAGHDHADRLLHENLTTPNFRLLGWDPLVSESYGTTVQGALCGDARDVGSGRRLAAIQGRGDVVATIADVTDASAPRWLGEIALSTTYVYDLALLPDGRHVALATSTHKTPERAPAAAPLARSSGAWWRSVCTGGEWVEIPAPGEDLVPRPRSLVLVSIEDPSAPAIVDQQPIGGFGHGVSAADVGGRAVVVASALECTGLDAPVVAPVPTSRCPAWAASWHFFERSGDRLAPLSVYTVGLPTSPELLTRQNHHDDAWIAPHPGTGRTYAWLAAWDDGLRILDVTDPRSPTLVGTWSDFEPDARAEETGKMHSVFPMPALRDGRHYTLVGPEHGAKPASRPTGVVYVLDTTDPAAIDAVAGWTLPHDVTWESFLMFSTHYLSAVGDTAFVSMYHGGIWALDLAGVRPGAWTLLPSVGVFAPTNASPHPPANPVRWAPTVEEVLPLPDGTLVTFDSNTGVYTFAFDPTGPVASPEPWPLDDPDPAN